MTTSPAESGSSTEPDDSSSPAAMTPVDKSPEEIIAMAIAAAPRGRPRRAVGDSRNPPAYVPQAGAPPKGAPPKGAPPPVPPRADRPKGTAGTPRQGAQGATAGAPGKGATAGSPKKGGATVPSGSLPSQKEFDKAVTDLEKRCKAARVTPDHVVDAWQLWHTYDKPNSGSARLDELKTLVDRIEKNAGAIAASEDIGKLLRSKATTFSYDDWKETVELLPNR